MAITCGARPIPAMSFLPEPQYTHGTPGRTALLLVNLGTPEAPTPRALRRYLREFLSDPRVIELNKAIWYPILYGAVLTTPRRRNTKAARTTSTKVYHNSRTSASRDCSQPDNLR